MNDVTIITPALIKNEAMLSNFKTAMGPLYKSFGAIRPKHIFSISAPEAYYTHALDYVRSLGGDVQDVSKNARMLEAYIGMLAAVKTKYVFLYVSDVLTVVEKDFVTPCAKAMDEDDTLVQVKISGTPFNANHSNTACLSSDGENVFFTNDPAVKMNPHIVGDDIVWKISLQPKLQKFFYPFAMWCTISRTDFARRLLEKALPLLHGRGLTNVEEVIDWRCLTAENRWASPYEFISDYTHGYLNLAAYLYAPGREDKPIALFAAENCKEVNKVPPAGPLG